MADLVDGSPIIQGATDGTEIGNVSDSLKITPIAGQSGVQANTGVVTAATQRVTLATDVALPTGANVIGSIASITTSVIPGTGATHLGKAEDAAHNMSDTGVMALGVRNDANVDTTSNDLDYSALSVDSVGRLKLAGSTYFHPIFTLRVQAVSGATGSATTSLNIPITSTSSGNFIAVAVSSSTAATITVTDNLAQSYTTAISGTSGTHTNYIFFKANTSAGVTSITITASVNSGMCGIVTEYFGISTTPFDKSSTGTVVNTTPFNSGTTATTTSAVELLLGTAHGVTKNNQTYTAGTSWTSVATVSGFNAGAGQLYMEDQYVSVVGGYAATGTASGNDTIIADIATFIVTNTNLISVNQPKTIKSGAGVLRRIIVNTIGTGSPTLTIYDNTTNSGQTIAVVSLLNAVGSLEYNLNFTTGLTIVSNSATPDFTLVYD